MSDSAESPARFNLEFLRKAARRLTRAARAGDADAITRLQRVLPRLARLDAAAVAAEVRLADTQHATPRGWAVHGSMHCRTAGAEYQAVLGFLT